MALIKCPECGKEMSDQAKACPNCGYKEKKKFPLKTIVKIAIIIVGIAIFIFGYFQGSVLLMNSLSTQVYHEYSSIDSLVYTCNKVTADPRSAYAELHYRHYIYDDKENRYRTKDEITEIFAKSAKSHWDNIKSYQFTLNLYNTMFSWCPMHKEKRTAFETLVACSKTVVKDYPDYSTNVFKESGFRAGCSVAKKAANYYSVADKIDEGTFYQYAN